MVVVVVGWGLPWCDLPKAGGASACHVTASPSATPAHAAPECDGLPANLYCHYCSTNGATSMACVKNGTVCSVRSAWLEGPCMPVPLQPLACRPFFTFPVSFPCSAEQWPHDAVLLLAGPQPWALVWRLPRSCQLLCIVPKSLSIILPLLKPRAPTALPSSRRCSMLGSVWQRGQMMARLRRPLRVAAWLGRGCQRAGMVGRRL